MKKGFQFYWLWKLTAKFNSEEREGEKSILAKKDEQREMGASDGDGVVLNF